MIGTNPMHRYSYKIVQCNEQQPDTHLGVRLGRRCIAGGIPVTEISKRLNVTRQTIYNWFCGVTAPRRPEHIAGIEEFLAS